MTIPGQRVSVTGATGFIGTHLCTRLLERGCRVRILVRNPARGTSLKALGAETVVGDLFDVEALRELARDCDAVVHCAGSVRGRSLEQFRTTNVLGTENLLRAVEEASPGAYFLLLSSLAAREPQLSWYARSKREGEDLVTTSRLDWCVLRPPAVYGPGDEEMKTLFDMMRRGIALVPGSADARTSLVHVADLVAAVLSCLQSPDAARKVLYACDGKAGGYDWREIADLAADVFQRPVRLVHPPGLLLDTVAGCILALAKITGGSPMLTPKKLNELRFPDWVVSNDDISEATGWTPEVSLREGLIELRDSAL